MPQLDEEIEEVNSSIASATDDQQQEQADNTVDTSGGDAKSSPATGEKDNDLLSVVRDAVDKAAKPASPAPPAEGQEKTVDDQEPKKLDNETYSDVPFSKHPRFRQLVAERNSLREDATRYRNVQGFLDQSGVSGEEAHNALVIASLIKTQPTEAWKQLRPIVESLLVAAGEILPPDLQQRVQAGEIPTEAAIEISRHRATAQSVQAAQSFREQQEQRRRETDRISSIQSAAQEWEQDRRLKDPNFEAKVVALRKEVAWLHSTEGKPNTPEGVREQLAKAYKAVNATFVSPTPPPSQRPAITPVRGGQVAGNVRSGEVSTLDIVRQHTRAR